MRGLAVALSVSLLACAGAENDASSPSDAAGDLSMIGAWDAQLSLQHAYPLGLRAPADHRICGTIGFVENHNHSRFSIGEMPTLGVYDLDLARLGLDWLNDNSYPAAVASVVDRAGAERDRTPRDSITIVLNPGSQERIVLRGQASADGIDGDWTAQSARGTATGSFSLRPHDGNRSRC